MRLRALEPEDLELLYTIENNLEQWSIGTQTAPLSAYQLRDYIANNQADIYKDEQVRFVIEDNGKGVGLIDLFNFSPQHDRAELGIALLNEAQGRGLAQQAIRQLTDYARNIISLHQIYAIIPENNERSLSMLEAQNFEKTAILTEWLKFGKKYENAVLMRLIL